MNALGINQGTSGNISLRDGEGFLITPTSMPYDDMQPEDIIAMRFDRTVVGEWPSVDRMAIPSRHLARAVPTSNAIVHAHPIYSTTLAILERGIPPLHYMVCAAGGDISAARPMRRSARRSCPTTRSRRWRIERPACSPTMA